jgi:predicted TPR repeat methyltransferase
MRSSSTMANALSPPDGDPLEYAEALIAEGQPDKAAALLQAHLDAGRGGLMLRLALADALLASGETPRAVEVARETMSLNPGIAVAALGLGKALLAAGLLPTAIGELQRALRTDPALQEARFALGLAWLEAGEAEKALEAFQAIAGDFPMLAAKIAQAEAMRLQPRSDAGYVRHLFDQFSHDYDERMLGQLCYSAPRILRDLATMTMGPPRKHALAILDLGCGTGLSGAAFKDMASRLDGVDLSPAMIGKARTRAIYDELVIGDLMSALESPSRQYDLILAADTLVYLGDLASVFAGAARRLAPGGFFLFTVEKKAGEGFELGPKRRWRHSEVYLRRQAARAGLEVSGFLECSPRSEAGKPVEGHAVALERSR